MKHRLTQKGASHFRTIRSKEVHSFTLKQWDKIIHIYWVSWDVSMYICIMWCQNECECKCIYLYNIFYFLMIKMSVFLTSPPGAVEHQIHFPTLLKLNSNWVNFLYEAMYLLSLLASLSAPFLFFFFCDMDVKNILKCLNAQLSTFEAIS